jgi:hypothetical protein
MQTLGLGLPKRAFLNQLLCDLSNGRQCDIKYCKIKVRMQSPSAGSLNIYVRYTSRSESLVNIKFFPLL